MKNKFSVCEIVELAIQIEKNGKDFYAQFAKIVENKEAKDAVEFLSSEEEKHISSFSEIFSSSCSYEPEGAYPDEYFAYMHALASQYIFTQKNKGKETAQAINNYEEGLDLGISFEKESILFYEGMKKMVSEENRKIINEIISEEQKHLNKLHRLKEGV